MAGTTPPSAAPKTPSKPGTESQFLQQQADEAQRAISRTISLLGTNAGHGVDPRVWTRAHPIVALGAAAAGGFLAVNLMPSAQQRELRKSLRKSFDELKQEIAGDAAKAGSNGHHDVPKKAGLLSQVMHELMIIVRPAIITAISTAIAGNRHEPPPPSENVTEQPTEPPPETPL